jgi:flagellar hook-associated protein 2
MRIGGLASGMDIDSIIKDMMKINRMPLDKLKQKKQILEWQRDDFRAINTKLLAFRDRLSQLKLTTSYRPRTVSSSDEAKVAAAAASGASQASYSIEYVSQLATAAYRVSGKIGPENGKADPADRLWNQSKTALPGLSWSTGVLESKTLTAAGGSSEMDLELDGARIAEMNVKVNGKAYKVVSGSPGEGEVSYDSSTGKLIFSGVLAKGSSVRIEYVLDEKTISHTSGPEQKNWNLGKGSIAELELTIDGTVYSISSADIGEDGYAEIGTIGKINAITGEIIFHEPLAEGTELSATFKQHYSSFEIGSHQSKGKMEEKIFFTGNDTLNSVIRKVNESSAGVTMFYDSIMDQVTLTRKETGDFNNGQDGIILNGDFLMNVLKFSGTAETRGQNAVFKINGLETYRHSNTFEMNGVAFTLKQAFSGPVSVTVGNDTEKMYDTIKQFVEQYNELIAEINQKLNEERHRSYHPLTDEEREQLSEKQQEKWEELARSGLLKGDPILSAVLSQMRLDMSSSVETNGLYKQLAAIGITTTSNYREGGKLQIDEAKLKEALERDPEAVENLFRGTGTSNADRGIIHKLYDTVNQSMGKIHDKAGRAMSANQQFAIGRELVMVDKNISRFEERLKMVEDRLWRQFTAMEKAIQRANDQSLYLMQQFGGWN